MRSGFTAPSLIKLNDVEFRRVEVLTVCWVSASPWPTMDHHDGYALRVSRFFPCNGMEVGNLQKARVVCIDWRVEYIVQCGDCVQHDFCQQAAMHVPFVQETC